MPLWIRHRDKCRRDFEFGSPTELRETALGTIPFWAASNAVSDVVGRPLGQPDVNRAAADGA